MLSSVLIAVFLFTSLHKVQVRGQLYASRNLEDRNTVLLGGLFPVHATGNSEVCTQLQGFAVQQVEAMAFAIDCINNDSSLLPGVRLGYTIRDTCSNPSHALQQAFHYVQSSNSTCSSSGTDDRVAVSGVIGSHFSRVSMDIANLLRLYKIPQISYTSTADLLSDKSRFDYFFRTVPPDSLQAQAIAEIVDMFSWRYVFALYSDDSYGRGGIEALIVELRSKGREVCVAALLPLSVTASPADYDKAVQKMNSEWVSNATVAVLFGHLDAATGIMSALKRKRDASSNGFKLHDLTWIGTDSWGDSLPPEFHEIARGMLSVIPLAVESNTFNDYFTSLHPSTHSDNVWFSEFWDLRFNCSLSDMTCRQSQTLNTTDHMQYSLVTLVVDAVMAFAHAIHSLIESRCPNSTLCDDVLVNMQTGRAVKGELIREHLYNISFQGASSNLVTFDSRGDEPGAYFVKNLQTVSESQYSFEIVGMWHHLSSLEIQTDRIEWVSNGTVPLSFCSSTCEGGHQPIPIADNQCCWTCSLCGSEKGYSDGIAECMDCNISDMPNAEKTGCIPIPVSFLKWSDVWAIVLVVVTLCGLLMTVGIIVVFIVCHNHKVIKASSREVSAILLLGLVLCYLMPLSFMAMPSEAVCAIRRFGVGFSFAVCFSALLVKTNRIHRIFNQQILHPSKPPRFTGPVSQVLITLLLISIQVIIAVVWLAAEHPSTDIAYASRTAELRCGESPIIGLSVTLGYNFLLLTLSTYFAFRARKVPENFNEAKYINVTLYTLCIVWLAFIPTYFATAKLGAVFQTSSLTVAIILSATTTLAFLFVPKFILLFSQIKEDKKTTENPPSGTFKTTTSCK